MNKLPLLLFLLIAAFFAVVLLKGKDPAVVDSALIGKPAPGLATRGKPALVNFFASWCIECRAEHKALEKIAADISIIGVDYKDTPEKLKQWLKKHGNPYAKIIADPEGRIAIDWGVYGVPETFAVDSGGIIVYKHTGAITEEAYRSVIQPLLAEIKEGNRR